MVNLEALFAESRRLEALVVVALEVTGQDDEEAARWLVQATDWDYPVETTRKLVERYKASIDKS
jgi:hypothetical protein